MNEDYNTHKTRKQKIFDMWLACHSQDEISETSGVVKSTVSEETSTLFDLGKLSKNEQSLANHAEPEFLPPHYNVWFFKQKSGNMKHFGNSEQVIVDNLSTHPSTHTHMGVTSNSHHASLIPTIYPHPHGCNIPKNSRQPDGSLYHLTQPRMSKTRIMRVLHLPQPHMGVTTWAQHCRLARASTPSPHGCNPTDPRVSRGRAFYPIPTWV